jgi:hypothetical protein
MLAMSQHSPKSVAQARGQGTVYSADTFVDGNLVHQIPLLKPHLFPKTFLRQFQQPIDSSALASGILAFPKTLVFEWTMRGVAVLPEQSGNR